MASTSSNFVVPLPPVVKVEVEEQVVPKDFRGYLTRALAWTALMPLFIVNFQRFPTLDAKKLVNAPKMSAHHRGICHF